MLSSQPPAQLRIVSRLSHWQIGTILLVVLVQGTGCVSLAANLLYAIRGNDLPAEYAGLNGKRVALLCDVDCAVANDAASSLLTSYIGAILSQRLAKSELVKQDEVERWREIEGWSGGNPAAVGSGVNADQVVAIQVTNLKLRDGATLFRGRCDIEVSVYDVAADGQLVFQNRLVSMPIRCMEASRLRIRRRPVFEAPICSWWPAAWRRCFTRSIPRPTTP